MGFRNLYFRAIDGTRTRDFHLGKVALYQLSHYRTTLDVIMFPASNIFSIKDTPLFVKG